MVEWDSYDVLLVVMLVFLSEVVAAAYDVAFWYSIGAVVCVTAVALFELGERVTDD